jgi:hypothetical protein
MEGPQIVDGGDDLQIWREAANKLNKQSRAADKGWSSSLVVGCGAKQLLIVKNKLVTKCHKEPRTWTDSLDKGPKIKKVDMKFWTWNVRSLYRADSHRTVAEEISLFPFGQETFGFSSAV